MSEPTPLHKYASKDYKSELKPIWCPGCGGLRMTHDLLHGDLAAAATDNVFLLVGLPLVALWWLSRRRARRPAVTPAAIAVAAAAAVLWAVVRNLPGFPLVPTLL